MTSTTSLFRALLLSSLSLMTIVRPPLVYAAIDIRGSWTGTFTSNHSNVQPFTIQVVITSDTNGKIVGNSTLTSNCLKNASLEVSITGSTVVLAGSDEKGDNMTVRGTLDSTGTMLPSTYVLNGSQGGGCETDDGTGTLKKQ